MMDSNYHIFYKFKRKFDRILAVQARGGCRPPRIPPPPRRPQMDQKLAQKLVRKSAQKSTAKNARLGSQMAVKSVICTRKKSLLNSN